MKKLFSLLTAFVIFLALQSSVSSCTKTETKTDTVTKTVTDTVLAANNSVAYRLFGKQWIVDSLYHNYTGGSNLGTRVYARGAANNTQNLDDAIVVMWPDGGQLFYIGGSYYNYSYTFQSADSTALLIHNPGSDYARIVALTYTRLTVYDSTNSAISFYEYKP